MKLAGLAIVLSLVVAFDAVAFDAPAASGADDEREVRNTDTLFWDAYNACDMRRIGELVTADIEFYHDKTGLTTSRAAVVDSLRNGPCADPTSRLRRALIDESLALTASSVSGRCAKNSLLQAPAARSHRPACNDRVLHLAGGGRRASTRRW
ncbi:nuclear transport factor 2 family protein [Xanthomonas sp. WHRI 10064A]|uniref:nuclear transport factor 2 family protein n=1 Tax=unclassified Xanthomonas TaxID=2643310 RepID=UPI002B238123|nr:MULTISPECIES: nuclear transport factor 2 family protein [unclassified Xanthomonas]MEA9586139.1 nuclear transport factor 2 family protein [Xanthomonas sp. WHRI 10064B]MEA9614566.1 nuclear transport factor 2 family protein [Xanthomonas sp. WHRI 10064A]